MWMLCDRKSFTVRRCHATIVNANYNKQSSFVSHLLECANEINFRWREKWSVWTANDIIIAIIISVILFDGMISFHIWHWPISWRMLRSTHKLLLFPPSPSRSRLFASDQIEKKSEFSLYKDANAAYTVCRRHCASCKIFFNRNHSTDNQRVISPERYLHINYGFHWMDELNWINIIYIKRINIADSTNALSSGEDASSA